MLLKLLSSVQSVQLSSATKDSFNCPSRQTVFPRSLFHPWTANQTRPCYCASQFSTFCTYTYNSKTESEQWEVSVRLQDNLLVITCHVFARGSTCKCGVILFKRWPRRHLVVPCPAGFNIRAVIHLDGELLWSITPLRSRGAALYTDMGIPLPSYRHGRRIVVSMMYSDSIKCAYPLRELCPLANRDRIEKLVNWIKKDLRDIMIPKKKWGLKG